MWTVVGRVPRVVTVATAAQAPVVLDEAAGLVRALAVTLVALDPRGLDLSRVGLVTVEDVAVAEPSSCRGVCTEHRGVPRDGDPLARPACRPCEVGMVAWLVRHPDLVDNPQDPHPVTLDAGFGPFIPDWPFIDGNHRLFAAAMLGLEYRSVAVAGDWGRRIALVVDEVDPDRAYGR